MHNLQGIRNEQGNKQRAPGLALQAARGRLKWAPSGGKSTTTQ